MNRKSYNVEDLRSYLLGAASAADAEQFDELSITDPEFADLLGAAEKDLIDSYIQGELDIETHRRFEETYFASPLRFEKVRFAQAFKEYSDESVGQVQLEEEVRSAIGEDRTSFLSRLMGIGGLWSGPALAMAAGVIALVTLFGWLAVRDSAEKGVEVVKDIGANNDQSNSSPSDRQSSPTVSVDPQQADESPSLTPAPPPPPPKRKIEELSRPVIASIVLRPPLRGASVSELRIPRNATSVSARLELESDDFSAYSAELVNATSGAVIWRRAGLRSRRVRGSGSLTLNLPANILRPSMFTIRILGRSPEDSDEILGDYPFRVVP